jgi:hypothetical protein
MLINLNKIKLIFRLAKIKCDNYTLLFTIKKLLNAFTHLLLFVLNSLCYYIIDHKKILNIINKQPHYNTRLYNKDS